MIDIDHFKQFNDTYGHQRGDECLRLVAQTIAGAVSRPSDLPARYGGEEFAVVIPGADVDGIAHICEKIQNGLRSAAIAHETSTVGSVVTVSMGVASMRPSPDDDPATLIRSADEALYRAKAEGRNRVVTA